MTPTTGNCVFPTTFAIFTWTKRPPASEPTTPCLMNLLEMRSPAGNFDTSRARGECVREGLRSRRRDSSAARISSTPDASILLLFSARIVRATPPSLLRRRPSAWFASLPLNLRPLASTPFSTLVPTVFCEVEIAARNFD